MSELQPYNVNIPEHKLLELKAKLSNPSFPDELEDSAWERGSPLADVKRLTEYWATKYDWRKVEASINDLPNFKTAVQVDGFGPIGIHFLHQQSSVVNAIPLLFVHGCTYPSVCWYCQRQADSRGRAWNVLGGRETSAPPWLGRWQVVACLPYRSTVLAQLRLLRWRTEEGLRIGAIRRGLSQPHAEAGLPGIRHARRRLGYASALYRIAPLPLYL